jgi:DNA-binding PadR family transcriptional regulator
VPREKFHTLTEQMFYILLCLKEECCGMDILDQIPAMTGGRVNIGSGTLYNLLDQFYWEDFIQRTKTEGLRQSYILTEKGKQMLEKEYQRIQAQVQDYHRIFQEELYEK